MIRRLPLLPTLVVLVAAAIMVRLGVWQLDRLHQKEAMIAQFRSELARPSPTVDLDGAPAATSPDGYRRVRVTCSAVGADRLKSGRNAAGDPGWAHVFPCRYAMLGGTSRTAEVVAGWSAGPSVVTWAGGSVAGLVVPESMTDRTKWHVVADPPLAGLQANATPDPRDLPNNHLAYAVQWFAFALIAVAIYGVAVRKRLRGA